MASLTRGLGSMMIRKCNRIVVPFQLNAVRTIMLSKNAYVVNLPPFCDKYP